MSVEPTKKTTLEQKRRLSNRAFLVASGKARSRDQFRDLVRRCVHMHGKDVAKDILGHFDADRVNDLPEERIDEACFAFTMAIYGDILL